VSIPSDANAVRMHPLNRDEEQRYFKAAFNVVDRSGRRNLYDAGRLIINQGCRPEDVMSSRKADLDVEAGTIRVQSKTRAGNRILFLTPESLDILAPRLTSDGPWLFPSERYPGNHITKLNNSHDRACREATTAWREELEKAGKVVEANEARVSFVLYDLRHTFGTRQATEEKTDPFTLARIMGHSNLRTIMKYMHPEEEPQREAMRRYVKRMQQKKLRRVK
jgi:integrase